MTGFIYIYIFVCYFYGSGIRLNNSFNHTFWAIVISFFLTPILAKKFYYSLYPKEVNEMEKKKEYKRNLEINSKRDLYNQMKSESEILKKWSKRSHRSSK
jgi:hypothetical protein